MTTPTHDFVEALEEFRAQSKWAPFITPYTVEELQERHATTVLYEEGAGYCVFENSDGYIECAAVFNDTGFRGVAYFLVQEAIDFYGANYVECFEGHLSDLYAKLGFEIFDRIPFNDEYAQPGWDYDRWGRPDVVLMRLPGAIH